MRIQKPGVDNIRVLIPEVIAHVDKTAEPTVENIGALNLTQDIIAGGGVIAGVWDGRPDFRPVLGTDLLRGDDSTFESDTGNWDRDAGVTIAGGKLVFTAAGAGNGAEITVPVTTSLYSTSITIDGYSAGSIRIIVGGTNGTARNADGTFLEDITAGAGTTIRIEAVAAPATLNVTIATVRHKAAWRIDTALERRARADLDFMLLDRFNSHEAYASAIQSVVESYAAATDSLPASPLEIQNFISGLLGEPRAYASFDGESAEGVIATPNITVYSIEVDIYLESFTDAVIIGRDGGATNYIQITSPTLLTIDTSGQAKTFPLSELSLRTWYNIIITVDSSFVHNVHLDAALQGTQTFASANTLTSSDRIGSKAGTDFLTGRIKKLVFYNRILAEKEIQQMGLGVPVPKPLIIDDDSSMNSVANYTPVSCTIASVSGAMEITRTGGAQQFAWLDTPTVVGHRYKLEGKAKSGTSGNETFAISTSDTGFAALAVSVNITGTSSAAFVEGEGSFTAEDTTTRILLQKVSATPGTMFFDDLYVTDLDLNTTFPLLVDQWGVVAGAEGAVAAYQPDGLTVPTWFDRSINVLHADLTDVDVWNIPDEQHPGFAYWELTPFNLRYLFMRYNPLALVALAALKIGWLVWGKSYTFELSHDNGSFNTGFEWPGLDRVTTEGGAVYVEENFGLRPAWDLTFIKYNEEKWSGDIEDFINRVGGGKNPYYLVTDYDAVEPILHRVRLTGGIVPVTYSNGEHSWDGVRLTMTSEGT